MLFELDMSETKKAAEKESIFELEEVTIVEYWDNANKRNDFYRIEVDLCTTPISAEGICSWCKEIEMKID